jgi:hypothetical protein
LSFKVSILSGRVLIITQQAYRLIDDQDMSVHSAPGIKELEAQAEVSDQLIEIAYRIVLTLINEIDSGFTGAQVESRAP